MLLRFTYSEVMVMNSVFAFVSICLHVTEATVKTNPWLLYVCSAGICFTFRLVWPFKLFFVKRRCWL